MISYHQLYDKWAQCARLSGLTEWPEPGTPNVWTGKDGQQYGVWNGDMNYGVLCETPQEFNLWYEEEDLPSDYTSETMTDNGDIRHFTKEPPCLKPLS
jgi:hypothetical protein